MLLLGDNQKFDTSKFDTMVIQKFINLDVFSGMSSASKEDHCIFNNYK